MSNISLNTAEQKEYGSFRKLLRKLYEQRYLQMMSISGVIFMLIFCYIPMAGIIIAFKDYRITSTIWNARWVGFEHFIDFVTDERFLLILRNTLFLSIAGLLIMTPLKIILALFLNEIASIYFKRLVQTISYLPHFISWSVLGGIIITLLSSTGLLNNVLISFGLIKEPIIYLAEPKYFWSISIISNIWKELGWSTILYLAAIAGIDPCLYESATIDGAGRFRRMWHITLPSIKFTIAILLIMSISHVLNSNFNQILILSNALNRETSDVINIFVYREGMGSGKYSFVTAAGLLQSIVSMILLILSSKASKKLADVSFF